jgi:hypothetical protein
MIVKKRTNMKRKTKWYVRSLGCFLHFVNTIQEALTEKQRMDEGRRMFQIFAARMFEQRVLTAYREKVALERQQKLIEELDDESRVDAQREAKKAKEAQKKKDKKRQQKMAKDEERANRDAEKAAEEAAAKALEVKKAEEVRQRREEHRKKKDIEKRAQEQEKQRREAEKLKRLQDAKQQQAEQDRKQREAKEREKKKKEEVKQKEREEREAKEKEVREEKERDALEKKDREAKARADNDAKEQRKKDEAAAKQPASTGPKRPTPITAPSGTASLPPGLHPPSTSSSHASPRLPVATPILPKALTPKIPAPARPRQASFQESHNASPKTSQPAYSSSTAPPSISSVQQNGATPTMGQSTIQASISQPSNPPSRYSPAPVTRPPGLTGMPSISTNAFASPFGPPISPLTQQAPYSPAMYSNQPQIGRSQQRNFASPNGIPFPPGMNGPRHMPQALDRMVNTPLAQMSPPGHGPNDAGRFSMSSQVHSRNTSASFERPSFDPPGVSGQSAPMSHPAPIGRPSSVAPHQQHGKVASPSADVDEITNHLGSKALLDDTDDTLTQLSEARGSNMAHGAPRSIGRGFGSYVASGFSDRMDNQSHGMPISNGNNWGNQQSPFGHPPMLGAPSWSNPPGMEAPFTISVAFC